MSLRLDQIDKLPPSMREQAMADQARATAARERIMAQWKHPLTTGQPSSFTPPAKSPPKALNAQMQAILPQCPGEWLPAKALHAIPNRNFGAPSGAVSKSAVRDESLATPQRETLYSGRVHVRITSYRRRLLDPDNLTAKWFLDACRYTRLIRDDNPEAITYQVGQEKVARKEDERTEIVIEPL